MSQICNLDSKLMQQCAHDHFITFRHRGSLCLMSILNTGSTSVTLKCQQNTEWQPYLHVLVEHFTDKGETPIFQLLLCDPSHANLQVIIIHVDMCSSLGKGLHYKSSEPHWSLMICVTKCWVGAISMTVVQFSLVTCHRPVSKHL